MRKHFLVIALGSLFGLAWCADDVVAQDDGFGTNGNLWASVGWSYMDLPAVRKLSRTKPPVPGARPFEKSFTDHDGDMDDGWRVDAGARLFGFPMNGSQATVGVKGFYARYEDTQSAECSPDSAGARCNLFPLFDPDPTTLDTLINNVPNSKSITNTSRDVDHWGVAFEWASVGPMGGTAFAPRIGLAIKVIDQDIELNYSERLPPGVVASVFSGSYSEDLETYYYGLYVGGETWFALGGGFSLGLDGEVGLYYARTDYDGTQNFNFPAITVTQSHSLNNDKAAVIGSLKAELKNTLGMAEFSLFAMADYYSYAPEMEYNQQDIVAGPIVFGSGGKKGTTIDDGEAWSATVGGKVTLRLN